jgi:hypothetical protein
MAAYDFEQLLFRPLSDVFARIADLPQTRLHELLPWEWKQATESVIAKAA